MTQNKLGVGHLYSNEHIIAHHIICPAGIWSQNIGKSIGNYFTDEFHISTIFLGCKEKNEWMYKPNTKQRKQMGDALLNSICEYLYERK